MVPEGWDIKKLKQLSSERISNGVFNDPKLVGSGYKLINVVNLYTPFRVNVSQLKLLNIEEKEFKKFRVENGDIFFTRSSLKLDGIAHCNIFDGADNDVVYECHIMRVRPDRSLVEPKYLKEFCSARQARRYFMSHAKTGTMTTIDQAGIGGLSVLLPPLPEQTKIAQILSTWDKAIETVEKLIENSKQQKKALMQQLLTGKKRFKEFGEPAKRVIPHDWNFTTLRDVADFANGKGHEKNIVEDGEYIVVNSKFISSDGKVVKRSDRGFCLAKKNDVLMVMSDVPNGRAIAKCFFVDEDEVYTVNQRVARLTANSINPKYLFYSINRNSYYLAFDDGIKQTNMRKDEVLDCPIRLPSSEEQEKIVDALDRSSDIISGYLVQLERLKSEKNALMQQLLTGKRRVKVDTDEPAAATA